MNKSETKDMVRKLTEAVDEEVDHIAYCPICEGYASVVKEDNKTVTLECMNRKCPMNEYSLWIDKS